MSHKSREPATPQGNTARPQQGDKRYGDRIEQVQHPPFGKTDADRRKEVRKAEHGSLRLCTGCGAVSDRKRWRFDAALREEAALGGRTVEQTLCPGCGRVDQGRIDGFVELRGAVIAQKPDEIRNLIDHVLRRARDNDPVHQIVSYTVMEDRIALETTSQWLAETIGKAVGRQVRGDLRIQFSPGEEVVRVYWQQS